MYTVNHGLVMSFVYFYFWTEACEASEGTKLGLSTNVAENSIIFRTILHINLKQYCSSPAKALGTDGEKIVLIDTPFS